MTLEIDFKNFIVKVDGLVNLEDLYNQLKVIFPQNYRDIKLVMKNTSANTFTTIGTKPTYITPTSPYDYKTQLYNTGTTKSILDSNPYETYKQPMYKDGLIPKSTLEATY